MGKTRKRKSIVYEKVVLPAILASLPDGVVVVDEAGMIIEINAAAETLLQISGKENKGKELGQCVPNLKLKEILQSQKPRENIKLCKVIAYVKSSAKIIEKAQFMIEILSIILQDESDAEASIILKEGLYEPESPHQKTSCRSTGRARTIKLCRKHTQHLPKILQPVDHLC